MKKNKDGVGVEAGVGSGYGRTLETTFSKTF